MKILFIILACAFILFVILYFRPLHQKTYSYNTLKAQADSAISQVGGAEVLEKEVKYLLGHFGAARGNWRGVDADEEKNCPAIAKLRLLLTTSYGRSDFWTSGGNLSGDVPAHVEVRLGTHAYYLYLWIFDGEHLPSRQIEGLEHLNGTVYLANKRT